MENVLDAIDLNGNGKIEFSGNSNNINFIINRIFNWSHEYVKSSFIIKHGQSIWLIWSCNYRFTIFIFLKNKDGFITRDEVNLVMCGIKIDDKLWNEILEEVDKNKDGKFSKSDFY